MSRQHDEQAIALAALFQAAELVDQIANRGMVSQNSLETMMHSLFITDPRQTEDVYGGVEELRFALQPGIKSLSELVDKSRSEQNRHISRYVLSMIHLESKLSKNPQMLEAIGRRVDQIKEQAKFYNPDDPDPVNNPATFCHPSVVASVASLYQETLSTMSFRIQVKGNPRNLQNAENADKIRALLLAGIRAAILWRQVGGKRWHMLFFKSRVRPTLKKLSS
ncbi:MAG: high frequency lysogenization protein HflD [Pontibacterium sp.]